MAAPRMMDGEVLKLRCDPNRRKVDRPAIAPDPSAFPLACPYPSAVLCMTRLQRDPGPVALSPNRCAVRPLAKPIEDWSTATHCPRSAPSSTDPDHSRVG